MYCPNCGSKINDDSVFCTQCGARQSDYYLDKEINMGDKKAPTSAVPGESAQLNISFEPAANDINVLIKRGFIALEDKEWVMAAKFFESALNTDPECAEAYFGKALLTRRCSTMHDLVDSLKNGLNVEREQTLYACPEDDIRIEAVSKQYSVPKYLTEKTIHRMLTNFQRTYKSETEFLETELESIRSQLRNDKLLSHALRFAKDEFAKQLNAMIAVELDAIQAQIDKARKTDNDNIQNICGNYETFLDNTETAVAERNESASRQRDKDYIAACGLYDSAKTISEYRFAGQRLRLFGDYKDANQLSTECFAVVEKMEAKEKAAEEKAAEEDRWKQEQRAMLEKDERSKCKKQHIFVFLSVVISVVVILLCARYVHTIELNNSDSDVAENDVAAVHTANEKEQEAIDEKMHYWEYPEFLKERKTIAAGGNHVIAILNDGSVIASGDNSFRQCDVTSWTDVVEVDAGANFSVGLRKNKVVVVAGSNGYNVRDVAGLNNVVKIAAGYDHVVCLKNDGTVVAAGRNDSMQCEVSGWTDIISVAAGMSHTVGLKADGTVVTAGANTHGECDVSSWSDIREISSMGYSTIGLKNDGTVVAAGANFDGKCNVSGWSDIISVSAGTVHTVGLKSDGSVVAVGDNAYNECSVSGWTDIVQVSAGGHMTVGLKSDGSVLALGPNSYGECDLSGWIDIKMPEGIAKAEEPLSQPDIEAKEAYAQVLRKLLDESLDTETARFGLVYLDEDDVPELVYANGSDIASSVELFTYQNGTAIHISCWDSTTAVSEGIYFGRFGELLYHERQNDFALDCSPVGAYVLATMKLNGATATEEHVYVQNERTNPDLVQYSIDDQTVSEAEFYKLAPDYNGYTSFSENQYELTESNIKLVLGM